MKTVKEKYVKEEIKIISMYFMYNILSPLYYIKYINDIHAPVIVKNGKEKSFISYYTYKKERKKVQANQMYDKASHYHHLVFHEHP
jgi:hypothetical protein